MKDFNEYSLIEREFIDFGYQPITELSKYIKQLDKCFKKDSDNFAEICTVVYKIHKLFEQHSGGVYLKNNPNMNYSFDTIMLGFNISKSESSKLLSCYEKFVHPVLDNDKPFIRVECSGFSKSKLFELIPVETTQIIVDIHNKVIRPDFTCKQLRDYVKNYQAQLKQNLKLNSNTEQEDDDIDESEIPEAYDPKQHYDFDYFESKNKAQLLNIVWDLQKEYERLKKETLKK